MNRSLAAELANARTTTLLRLGKVAEGEAMFEEAASLAAGDGRSDLAVLLWANSAAAAACRGEFRKVLAYARLPCDGDATSWSTRWTRLTEPAPLRLPTESGPRPN